MRREQSPHFEIEFVFFLGLAPQDRDVSREQIAQRPAKDSARDLGIPFRDNTHDQTPLAEILGAALDPSPAF
jgi:hypothetical protein